MNDQKNPVAFVEESNTLFLNVLQNENIKITIMNQMGETVERMQLIGGRHRIDLSALMTGQYSVRIQAGENVIVRRINVTSFLEK